MKLLIASDLHGSAHYCEKLLERIDAEQPDKILLLGDLLMAVVDPRISFTKKEGSR